MLFFIKEYTRTNINTLIIKRCIRGCCNRPDENNASNFDLIFQLVHKERIGELFPSNHFVNPKSDDNCPISFDDGYRGTVRRPSIQGINLGVLK
ncbi:hypothetical protein ACOME3_010183 [Neoechinorhynchus agilis]